MNTEYTNALNEYIQNNAEKIIQAFIQKDDPHAEWFDVKSFRTLSSHYTWFYIYNENNKHNNCFNLACTDLNNHCFIFDKQYFQKIIDDPALYNFAANLYDQSLETKLEIVYHHTNSNHFTEIFEVTTLPNGTVASRKPLTPQTTKKLLPKNILFP